MSARQENEELRARCQVLGDLLDGHHGAQVSCAEALATARTATAKAVRLATEANERAARAERQVTDRDVENAVLAEQNRALLAVVQAMQAEDLEAGFTS